MSQVRTLSLFEGFGVELEYMIVSADSLSVDPVADQLLRAVTGTWEGEVERGALAWSNELALHVIELKTNGPAGHLAPLANAFHQDVREMNRLLKPLNARLMPSAAHPWMDPYKETLLWPHDYNAVYAAFDRIFSCKGHGWSNLQSVHLNLPFSGDEEFGRLHAAIRVLLPLMPALAASSPVLDGQRTGQMDSRLEMYRHNAAKVPSISGRVIPERVYDRAQYESIILQKIYDDLAPLDPEGTLREEWVNARGAIARFDRSTIEVRVLDIQECPLADLAVIQLLVETLRELCAERWVDLSALQQVDEVQLESILLATIRDAEEAVLIPAVYAGLFGCPGARTARDVWVHLASTLGGRLPSDAQRALDHLLTHGTLARRMVRRLEAKDDLPALYRDLCDCLEQGVLLA